ncbi:uncharacterized protein BJ171DRAFT_422118 [Polychytrium aggregatum]|uniref:uncharacterized protein n=1 Tax=Polychytrium aggregatum TaxID=110093 RepID=UPI0022FE8E5B|nr:uncharacterized protein BJ171DRAFT_422118 [Polychytrium aggregatum]KAI9206527.1 hypothetical protein BJ171DRAFT_422118 [Polychytrium aggregatum]
MSHAQSTSNPINMGKWEVIGDTGAVCIHLALLPNERFLCMERPHIHPYPINERTNGQITTELYPERYKGNSSTRLFETTQISYNGFCGHHTQMADGSIFFVGGDNQTMYDAAGNAYISNGRKKQRIYRPCADGDTACKIGTWDLSLPEIKVERWYPTAAALYDGSHVFFSGSIENLILDSPATWHPETNNNPTYEYYPAKPDNGKPWPRPLDILRHNYPYSLYPIAFQLPSKKVFLFVANQTMLLDPATDTIDYPSKVPDVPADLDHQPWLYPYTAHGILLPLKYPKYEATVLLCGGSKRSTPDASDMCISVQPDADKPVWTVRKPLLSPRLMIDGVLLPDGKILYMNGAGWGLAGGDAGTAQYARSVNYEAEIFDPETDTHVRVASASVMRMYHSTALLAPSGYVYTAGSEMQNVEDIWGNTDVPFLGANNTCDPMSYYGDSSRKLDLTKCRSPFGTAMERFTPPYLLTSKPRPAITSAPKKATYGSSIAVQIDPKAVRGGAISRVTLLRYASTTHQTNSDQRMIEIEILGKTDDTLYISLPPNGAVAPPGNWMLFVLSSDGVPSVAATVLLGGGPATQVSIPSNARSHAPFSKLRSAHDLAGAVAIAMAAAVLSSLV